MPPSWVSGGSEELGDPAVPQELQWLCYTPIVLEDGKRSKRRTRILPAALKTLASTASMTAFSGVYNEVHGLININVGTVCTLLKLVLQYLCDMRQPLEA
ncbi:hypothetical protein NDU88_006936 [Pleurodeles waltl]|uniref:Uncharacterized protein n=1 Tax=Pleurodeles waltl TaxID=8319 RepID=A0AAV7MEH3_PLEWA|nr:hypothetical protein NDU88_006936 [Pleurodeles waltl]